MSIEGLGLRFNQKVAVDPVTGCHNWTASIRADGYGQISFRGAPMKANRAAWLLAHGESAGDACVLHTCDNRRCCNPKHLFLGDRPTNSQDMVDKGRSSRGERNHFAKLTQEQAEEIRGLYKQGYGSYAKIAALYGLNRANVGWIVRGKTWR